MIFAILLICMLGVYLVIEERGRRVANPNSAGWWSRVRKSGKRKLWFVASTLAGVGIQLARKKDPEETLLAGAVAVVIIIFLILHEATLKLPRNDEKA